MSNETDTANYWQIIPSERAWLPWWAKTSLMSAQSPLCPLGPGTDAYQILLNALHFCEQSYPRPALH